MSRHCFRKFIVIIIILIFLTNQIRWITEKPMINVPIEVVPVVLIKNSGIMSRLRQSLDDKSNKYGWD